MTLLVHLAFQLDFLPSAPTGASEAAAGHHSVVSPRAFLGKTTLPAVAAQGAQLFGVSRVSVVRMHVC